MKPVKFYYNNVCPFAYRVRLALSEKDIEHEAVTIDLENIPPWYYELSPTAKVPLLQWGHDVIWESTVINEFIEDNWPNNPLLPSDPIARAQARIWIEYCNSQFQPSCCGLVFELDEKKHEAIKKALNESLDYIEAALSQRVKGPYWSGEQLTLVDLTFYPFFEHACVLSYYRGFELSDKYQHIHQWLKLMQSRPSVQQNCQSAEFYIEAYKPFVNGSIEH